MRARKTWNKVGFLISIMERCRLIPGGGASMQWKAIEKHSLGICSCLEHIRFRCCVLQCESASIGRQNVSLFALKRSFRSYHPELALPMQEICPSRRLLFNNQRFEWLPLFVAFIEQRIQVFIGRLCACPICHLCRTLRWKIKIFYALP